MSRSLLILALGLFAGALWARRARQLGLHKGRRELKAEVERWEDEGGNVPEVETVAPRPRHNELGGGLPEAQ